MLIGLLLGGLAGAQDDAFDDAFDDVMDEGLGVRIEMLEPDLDYLLETLEAVSCLCDCEDFCAGECAGAASCDDWCVCLVEPPEVAQPEPEPEPEPAPAPQAAPPQAASPQATLPQAAPTVSALVPFDPDSVFSVIADVRVPTCLCVWQFEDGSACNADVTWPAEEREDCDCERFEKSPGCEGEARVISVILTPDQENWRRR